MTIPTVVPLIGTLGCLFDMFIINATVSLVALVVMGAFHWLLARRHLDSPFADVRSGLFVALAQWAAQRVHQLPRGQERAWKPNLLVPIATRSRVRRHCDFVHDLVAPTGYLELMGLVSEDDAPSLQQPLQEATEDFRSDGIFACWTILESDDDERSLIHGMEALKGSLFHPNVLLAELPETDEGRARMTRLTDKARANRLGTVVFGRHPDVELGSRKVINLWIREESPAMYMLLKQSWINLAILLTYTLARNWNARINLVHAGESDRDPDAIRASLHRLVDLTRLPEPDIHLLRDDLSESLGQGPRADRFIAPPTSN